MVCPVECLVEVSQVLEDLLVELLMMTDPLSRRSTKLFITNLFAWVLAFKSIVFTVDDSGVCHAGIFTIEAISFCCDWKRAGFASKRSQSYKRIK